MKRKSKQKANLSFFHGFILASGLCLLAFSFLYTQGYLGLLSNTNSYADSVSPRKKNISSVYIEPTIDPTSTDKTLPVVSIVTPINGQTVKTNSCEPLLINATDNVGVMQVTYYLDGVLDGILMTTGVPYKTCVRIPGRKKTYTVTVNAYDYAGNKAETSISIIATQ